MCVQQNNLILTRNLKIPKTLPYTPTLDHKRDTHKNKFGSERSKANLQVNIQVLQTAGSTSDQNTPMLDPRTNISHNYVAPVRTAYERLNNTKIVDVSVSFKQHPEKKLTSDTKKSKIKMSEEGENDVYNVLSDVKEENIVNDSNTSSINGDDITEHPRRYGKHEALRIKPDFHDAQLISHPGDLKKCSGTIPMYRKNETYIAHSPDHNYTTSLRRSVYGLRGQPTTWNNVLRYVMNEYILKHYVATDGDTIHHYRHTPISIRG